MANRRLYEVEIADAIVANIEKALLIEAYTIDAFSFVFEEDTHIAKGVFRAKGPEGRGGISEGAVRSAFGNVTSLKILTSEEFAALIKNPPSAEGRNVRILYKTTEDIRIRTNNGKNTPQNDGNDVSESRAIPQHDNVALLQAIEDTAEPVTPSDAMCHNITFGVPDTLTPDHPYFAGVDNLKELEAVPDPTPLIISPNDMPLLYSGGFSVLSAAAGVGKSSFIAMLLSKMPEHKILWFDTEQPDSDRKTTMGKLAFLRGQKLHELQNVVSYTLMPFPKQEYPEIIKTLVAIVRPSIVVLDNIADAILDSQREDDAAEFINHCIIKTCMNDFGASVLGVIHNARTSGDIKGHAGSIALQKATIALNLVASPSGVEVSYRKHRHGRNDLKCGFVFDTHGIPHWSDVVMVATSEERNRWRNLFGNSTTLSIADIEKGMNLTNQSARNVINKAKQKGIIVSAGRGVYSLTPDPSSVIAADEGED